jgi:Beta-lactamase enzyme family
VDGVRAARRYALARDGHVAFAELGADGRIRGVRTTEHYPSASVVKAMLLVAALRRAGTRPLTTAERALLDPMIRVSDNEAAETVFGSVGHGGLLAVARVAGMRGFSVGALFDAQLTAADQVRFFVRIDRLVPRVHRAYARALLSGIVPGQSWGIAPVARARRFRVFFKGGWRTRITHQAALLERDGQRMALAVLTRSPSMGYGEASIAGVASRVLAR